MLKVEMITDLSIIISSIVLFISIVISGLTILVLARLVKDTGEKYLNRVHRQNVIGVKQKILIPKGILSKMQNSFKNILTE